MPENIFKILGSYLCIIYVLIYLYMKIFYICTYGGCGSKVLQKYLNNFGKTYHVHDPNPPILLEGVGDNVIHKFKYQPNRTHNGFFNKKIVPSSELNNIFVIYIYRNPIKSIISRFTVQGNLEKNPKAHLENIKGNPDITINDVINTEKDLFNLEKFFDNYTTINEKRNYKIICIKYEELWNNIEELNKILNIGNNISFPTRQERNINIGDDKKLKLEKIYLYLNKKMNNMKAIEIR